MSGIVLALAGRSSSAEPPPTVIGQAYGGGYYAGQIGVSGTATHYLVVGPVSSAQLSSSQYKNVASATVGATSTIDGPQNTLDLVADGNATVYPSAHFCNDLTVGAFSDWYMPAKNELEVCYYNLKPDTVNNNTSSGINPNAVPARASNYTTSDPAQTSSADFRTTGAEKFSSAYYWGSTSISGAGASAQTFFVGTQYTYNKAAFIRVRAVRRVAV